MSTLREGPGRAAVLVGGSGFVGSTTAMTLRSRGWGVTIVDVASPPDFVLDSGAAWRRCDLLVDDVCLPDGEVVLLVGNGNPRTRWSWHQPLQTVLTTGRLLPALQNRRVTLCSTLEVYGTASPPLTEDREPVLPWGDEKLQAWIDRGRLLFDAPCPQWRAAAWCREMVDADPTGRWVYGMAKRAQELLVADAVGSGRAHRPAAGQHGRCGTGARRLAAGPPGARGPHPRGDPSGVTQLRAGGTHRPGHRRRPRCGRVHRGIAVG